ncbi:hypothetical protein BH11BAC3_BH11BAC3_14580 [soil metagenome]
MVLTHFPLNINDNTTVLKVTIANIFEKEMTII